VFVVQDSLAPDTEFLNLNVYYQVMDASRFQLPVAWISVRLESRHVAFKSVRIEIEEEKSKGNQGFRLISSGLIPLKEKETFSGHLGW
jgi:hypothetical protein